MSAVLLKGYGFWRRAQAYSLTVPDAVRKYGKRHISGANSQIVGVFQRHDAVRTGVLTLAAKAIMLRKSPVHDGDDCRLTLVCRATTSGSGSSSGLVGFTRFW